MNGPELINDFGGNAVRRPQLAQDKAEAEVHEDQIAFPFLDSKDGDDQC